MDNCNQPRQEAGRAAAVWHCHEWRMPGPAPEKTKILGVGAILAVFGVSLLLTVAVLEAVVTRRGWPEPAAPRHGATLGGDVDIDTAVGGWGQRSAPGALGGFVDGLGEWAALTAVADLGNSEALAVDYDGDWWSCNARDPEWRAPPLIMYNRVFKTGSMSVGAYLNNLCFTSKPCTYVRSTTYDYYDVRDMPASRLHHFARRLSRKNFNATGFPFSVSMKGKLTVDQAGKPAPLPAVMYDAHMPYVDFTAQGRPQPGYINWVREPLRRLASHYSYNEKRVKARRKSDWPCSWNMTLNECLDMKRRGDCPEEVYDCQPPNMITGFLCGVAPECRNESSPEALALAMHNVQYNYDAIGVLEHARLSLDYFAATLKAHLNVPSRFAKWRRIDSKKINSQKKGTTSSVLRGLSEENMAQVLADNANDLRLYDFILEVFWERTARCGLSEPSPLYDQDPAAEEL